MLESTTPYLSLVDDSELEISSSASLLAHNNAANGTARLDKLEKDVLGLSRRLEEETQLRKRLQDLMKEAGINLPADLTSADLTAKGNN